MIGTGNALVLFFLASVRKRRVDLADIGPTGAMFLTSLNILPPVHIFRFMTNSESVATLPPGLQGYEKYIVLAAIFSFLFTFTSIFGLVRQAWKP
jgi:hypothetical protein